jgi:hypothetical protein
MGHSCDNDEEYRKEHKGGRMDTLALMSEAMATLFVVLGGVLIGIGALILAMGIVRILR